MHYGNNCHGTWQVPLLCHFVDNYFVMSACSFTMQTFNHNNYYIVMERGKFLYDAKLFVMERFTYKLK